MIRDILVHLKSYEEWSPHVDVAAALAKRFKAHLTGVFTDSDIATLRTLAAGPGGGQALIEPHLAALRVAEARTKARFDTTMADLDVASTWQTAEGRASEILTLLGRFHDLIVVEQTDRRHDEHNWRDVEEAAVQSGRPVLVAPRHVAPDRIGERILVAWNGSLQAARALHGAMDFIEAAQHVAVLKGESRERFPSITKCPPLDVEAYLNRHLANPTAVESYGGSQDEAGHAILAAADRVKADLIVMGGYGRRGLSAWIFGGATEKVLKDTQIPVLMST
jgi:nucleotide-binding universal stress UspA family protein